MTTDVFPVPGPGAWALDRSHYPGGTTPISQWLMDGCPTALRRAFAELGLPAETLAVEFVNGFMYSRLRPVIRPDKPAAKLPPVAVLKVATKLHPLMRKRAVIAADALATRPWRTVVADWSTTIRPRLEARNIELQSVDAGALDDAALADHLSRVMAWCRETVELHFYLHAFDLGPLGMLLHEGDRWGLSAAEIVPALGGASPSTAAPARALAALRAELAAHGVTTPTSLDDVRAASPQARELLDDYLARRGRMLITRYDLDGQTLDERPDTVLASIVSANVDPVDHQRADATIAALRARVPAAEQALFDERMTEARAAMDLRDDNGPFTVEWPVGILRHALLALGRRLAGRGRVHVAEHVFELRPDEVAPLARVGTGPGAEELAARAAERRRLAGLTPPAQLGPDEPAPPLTVLAPAHRVLVGATQMVIEHMGMAAGGPAVDPLQGTGIGVNAYRGRARLALDPEAALDAMEPGDVLVARFTTPAYNTVLTLAGAIVTTDGGALCHAAVMARELGIPAVIGAAGALDHIADGAEVEVDPVAGRVRLL